MSQTILCPLCEKHYSLPDQPPATFTCRQCGALVDLAAFGGKERAPKAPAVTAPPGAGRSKRRARRNKQSQPRAPRESKPPVAVIVTVLLIVVVLIAVRSGGDDPKPPPKKPPSEPVFSTVPAETHDEIRAPAETAATRTGRQRAKGVASVNKDGDLELRLGSVELKRLDWPEQVDAETRTRADEAIRTMYVGGADGQDAETWLVAQGRPLAGRLISEFVSIQESPGFGDRSGTAMAMQVDALLHKIDGFIERACNERGQIRSTGFYAGQSFIVRTAKRWTWWWESGEWKSNPRKPWDPFEDESDETPDGMKAKEPAKDDDKGDDTDGKGFGKRAGSG